MKHEAAVFRTGILASALLWLSLSSDWSLRGKWSDLVALWILTAVGLWIVFSKSFPRRVRLVWLPAALPGFLLLLIAPISSLGLLFRVEQQQSEHVFQTVEQPDGPWTASVVAREGYIGGGVHFELQLQRDWLPFLERSLTGGESIFRYKHGEPFQDVAVWLPDGRIRVRGVRGGSGEFEPDGVRWQVPFPLAAPFEAVSYLMRW